MKELLKQMKLLKQINKSPPRTEGVSQSMQFKPEPSIGQLHLKMFKAKLFHSSGTFEQVEPFVLVEHRGRQYKTKVDIIRGMNPQWYEVLLIENIVSMDDSVTIKIYDEDILLETPVGVYRTRVREL